MPVLAYGVFLNTVIEFLIIAFVIFLIVKAANKLQKPAPAAAPTTKPCPECTHRDSSGGEAMPGLHVGIG